MTNEAHPDDMQLAEFSERPYAGEFSTVRRHLLGCTRCRQFTERLASLPQRLQAHAEYLGDAPGDSPDPLIGRLHERVHTGAMRSGMRGTDPSHRMPWLKRWMAWTGTHRGSAWLAPVAAAIVVAVLAVALLPARSPALIAYRDQPDLIVQSVSAPGIGFFSAASRRTIPFDGVTVERSSTRSVRIAWPAVTDSSSYRLRLYRIENGQSVLLRELQTIDNMADLNLDQDLAGGRYEWRLDGETRNNESFRADGGFVVRTEPGASP